jgi:hypothetical protein
VVQKNLGVHDNDIKKSKEKGEKRVKEKRKHILTSPLSFDFTNFITRYDRMNMAFCAIHSKL